MSRFLGPALPPGFKTPVQSDAESDRDRGGKDECIGPSLPSSHYSQQTSKRDSASDKTGIGPQLPTNVASTICETEKVIHKLTTSDSGPKAEKRKRCAYGPTLPPDTTSGSKTHTYGPTLPLTHTYGPTLPPTHTYGPTLPLTHTYGPTLPPDLESSQEVSPPPGSEPTGDVMGPRLPSAVEFQHSGDSEEDEGLIGPLPMAPGSKELWELECKRREIESRAKNMKDQLTNKGKPADAGKPQQREEWMTELPAEIKPLGLGARKFRTAPVDLGDRSVWTDTPADRMRKAQESQPGKKKPPTKAGGGSREPEYALTSSREREVSRQVTEYNKTHRPESLMEMHRKRRAEERSGQQEERRPFNRETDLQTPRSVVTPAKRKALMKDSAKALDSKFMHGSSHFL